MNLLLKIKGIAKALRRERFFFIAPLTLGVILIASLGAFYFEHEKNTATIRSLWDGVWWAFVTICTVGYGDKVPLSDGGKIIGIFLMISGIGLLSMLTATVASVLVEQKMKEGRGLESIKEKGHVLICGWNNHSEEVIQGLLSEEKKTAMQIVLINELAIDEIDLLRTKYGKSDLIFLRGDFVHEDGLLRANIGKAGFAVIMADFSGSHLRERADDRTILAALAIKSLAPKIKAIAELLDGENKSHLRRANVDEIIVRGEHAGSLLAGAIKSPGLSKVFSGLLSTTEGSGALRREEIPKNFVGRTFEEFSIYCKSRHRSILIGFLKETKGVKVEDVLSDDASAIDIFIREKLKESKKDLFTKEDTLKVVINPENNYVIKADDYAVLLVPAGFNGLS
jgi:voltage-gated potassium channel